MKIGIYFPTWGTLTHDTHLTAALARALREDHDVEIIHHDVDFRPAALEEAWEMNLRNIAFRCVPPITEKPEWETWRPFRRLRMEYDFCGEISSPYDLFFAVGDTPPLFSHAKKSVMLVTFPRVTFPIYYGHETPEWRSQNFIARFLKTRYQHFEWRARFGSYRQYLCTSRFVKDCCRRRWGVWADILPPPVRKDISPSEKKPVILALGEISHRNINRHDAILASFRAFSDTHRKSLPAKWRLRILGSCDESVPRTAEFLKMLREKSAGYPVEIRVNPSAAEQRDALRQATLFWQATGYDVDERKNPELTPYDPITAAEAMAAGAIPMVYHAGAMPEVVRHLKTGILWSTVNELILSTAELLQNPAAMCAIQEDAHQAGRNYDSATFHVHLRKLLKEEIPQR